MSDVSDGMAKKTFELFAHGPEHHVIADLAARLAKAERALEEAKAEIERMTPHPPARREMAEARVSELERSLEEAEAVIKPLAEYAAAKWRPLPSPPKEG